jgi:Flp pilus assembly protein TadB
MLLGFAVILGMLRFAPIWDSVAAKRTGRQKMIFENLGMNGELLRWSLRVWGVGLPFVFWFLWLFWGKFLLACLCAFLLYQTPAIILEIIIRRRKKLLTHQLVIAASAMANCLKAGLSLPQGLEAIERDTPLPLAVEFRRINFEYQRGRPLQESLEVVRKRLNLEAFTLFALTLQVAMERGGRINESLQRIAISLRENERLQRKIESDTAAGRQVVLLLALFPALFLGFFYVLDPHYLVLLFETLTGQIMLVSASLFIYAGCRWANKMIHIEL